MRLPIQVIIRLISRRRRRIEAGSTHDDAVVALRRLDVELVLKQEPGGRHRVAEAAEHLGGKAHFWALALAALAAARHVPGAAHVPETGTGTSGGLALRCKVDSKAHKARSADYGTRLHDGRTRNGN